MRGAAGGTAGSLSGRRRGGGRCQVWPQFAQRTVRPAGRFSSCSSTRKRVRQAGQAIITGSSVLSGLLRSATAGEFAEMVVAIAEHRVDHCGALEIVADFVFHRHADPAVQLYRLLPDQSAGAADLHLRRRDCVVPFHGILLPAIIVPNIAMLRACSNAISMSTARCWRIW